MGIWDPEASTRYSTLPVPTPSHHPGYTPALPGACYTVYSAPAGPSGESNSAVGLKSVRQLSLYGHFSGFLRMTEVYNLVRIDRINNHFVIPGNK